MEKGVDGKDQHNFMNLDVSEIKWKDVTPVASGGMDCINGNKSMMDSIIFEFQDYIGRRSSSAPRRSNENKEKKAEIQIPQPADNQSHRSGQSQKRRNFKEWLENKKQNEQALDKKQLYGNVLNELKN